NQPVTPSFAATDTNLDTVTATLDGAPFVSGFTVFAEGGHTLIVSATDKAGNSTIATVGFVIDAKRPTIAISGVTEGAYYRAAVAPQFSASDAHLATVVATLNGQPFASGATVSGDGSYRLMVTAADAAGNVASSSISFVIDTIAPSIAVTGVSDG